MTYYKSQIYHQKTALDNPELCTLLMPTYRRVEILPLVVNHYCNMSTILHKIVLIWNDADNPVPPSVLQLGEECGVELKVLKMQENKLSNRFLPRNREEIETECKL